MAYIISYQKYIDAVRTVTVKLPEAPETHQMIGTELATIDGVTYVSLPDDAKLPEQPQEISVSKVTMTPELRSALLSASPHVRVINDNVVAQIRAMYSADDEAKILRVAMRTNPCEEFDVYNEHVESCRAWGRSEKAKLGL